MYRVYQVQSGETVNSIANKIGINPNDLINLNSLTKEVVPGELLVIPNNETVFETYTVVKGDNMYDIARRNNVNVNDLLRINGLNKDDYIYPGQQILIPKENVNIYVTEGIETLNEVADKLKTNPSDLIGQNETLYLTGDQLIIYRR